MINAENRVFAITPLVGDGLCLPFAKITPTYRNIIKVAVSHKTRKKLCC